MLFSSKCISVECNLTITRACITHLLKKPSQNPADEHTYLLVALLLFLPKTLKHAVSRRTTSSTPTIWRKLKSGHSTECSFSIIQFYCSVYIQIVCMTKIHHRETPFPFSDTVLCGSPPISHTWTPLHIHLPRRTQIEVQRQQWTTDLRQDIQRNITHTTYYRKF